MEIKDNIADFNECAAFVLAKLYDNFPVPIVINCHALQDADDPERIFVIDKDRNAKKPNTEKNGLYLVNNVDEIDAKLSRYAWTVHFLIREQYVRDLKAERYQLIQNYRGNALLPSLGGCIFENIVLTANGLSILNAIPESINGIASEPRIAKIKQALFNHSIESIRELITGMLASSAGMVVS